MRMHVNLRVTDLDASQAFYSSLFGVEPTLMKHDYARWALEEPRVNFAIVASKTSGGLAHLGIEAESPEELGELRARAARTGGPLSDEGETTCCYARSDKAWLRDWQGLLWEIFYTTGQVEDAPSAASKPAVASRDSGCCTPGCCGDEPAASEPSGTRV